MARRHPAPTLSARRTLPALALALAAALPQHVAAQQAVAAQPEVVYPAPEWQRIGAPEEVGWSSAGLARVGERLAEMPTTAFMAVVNGRVLFDYGDVTRVSYLASVRKSVLSMLVGIYRERGMIDMNRTLEQMGIDDHAGLTPDEKQATMLHLITARSGVYHEASNSGDDLASAPPRGSPRWGRRSFRSALLWASWSRTAATCREPSASRPRRW